MREYSPEKDAAERRRRIHLFFTSYGIPCPRNSIELTALRIEKDFCGQMREGAAAGDETCIRMIREGQLRHYEKVLAHLREHGGEWI